MHTCIYGDVQVPLQPKTIQDLGFESGLLFNIEQKTIVNVKEGGTVDCPDTTSDGPQPGIVSLTTGVYINSKTSHNELSILTS